MSTIGATVAVGVRFARRRIGVEVRRYFGGSGTFESFDRRYSVPSGWSVIFTFGGGASPVGLRGEPSGTSPSDPAHERSTILPAERAQPPPPYSGATPSIPQTIVSPGQEQPAEPYVP